MNRSERERIRIVRDWLGEGSTQLSPRVLDGVLRKLPATTQDRPFGSSWRPRTSAPAAVAAVAAAAVVIVVIASIRPLGGAVPAGAGPTAVPTPLETPGHALQPIDRSYRDVGFIGLPPPGAVRSGSGTVDLVEAFWLTRNSGAGYRGAALLYADGRLVWNEYVGGRSTGWLEQRLTSEGIDLVHDLGVGTSEPGGPRRLDPALLPNELPAGAWADITVRPYVPSGFAACLFVHDSEVTDDQLPVTLTVKLALLPEAARDILDERPLLPSTIYNGPGTPRGVNYDCLTVDTDDARRLDAALSDAGLEQDASRNRYLLEYHIDLDGDRPGTTQLGIWFEPVLPDGIITCSSCG